jgi:predicted dehydrogenase
VLVEKPMALNVKEANDMILASKKHKVGLCVDHNILFESVVLKAKEIVNSFDFGDLVHVESFFAFDSSRMMNADSSNGVRSFNWINDLQGGLLQDLSAHPVSLVLHFMRDYHNSYSVVKSSQTQNAENDELRVLLDSNKITGTISISLRAKPDNFILNLYGTKMFLKVDLSNMFMIKRKVYNVPKKLSRGVDNLSQSLQIFTNTISNSIGFAFGKVTDAGGINFLINEFYKSLEAHGPPPVSGEEGKQVVKLIDEIWN